MQDLLQADLKDPNLNKTAVDWAIEAIEKDSCSLALYPEGKRELIPYTFEKFKTGFARIAKQTGLLVLPITLKGTAECMPIGGFVYPGNIEMIIDEPFEVKDEEYCKYIDYAQIIITKNLFPTEENIKKFKEFVL